MKTLLTLAVAACAALTAHAWTATITGYTPSEGTVGAMLYLVDTGYSGGVDIFDISNIILTRQVQRLEDNFRNGASFSNAEELTALVKEIAGWGGELLGNPGVTDTHVFTPRDPVVNVGGGDNRNAYYVVIVETLSDDSQYVRVSDWTRYVEGDATYGNPEFNMSNSWPIALLPEPTALALLALGVAGVALRRRVTA